jgi:hypothetical protein
MKRILFLAILFLVSCGSPKNETQEVYEKTEEIDSLLKSSNSHIDTAVAVTKSSDSIVHDKVIKVIKEIKYLTKEVDRYRSVEKLTKEVVATEKIVYRIDTVYVETKKNFWGKEKTKTSVKSDSTVVDNIDTLIDKSIVIDTLQR